MAASSSKKPQDSSLTCQRCHQPLLLDPSIASLNPSSHNLVTSALPAPSGPSTLPAAAKLAQLPPSSQEAARIWAGAHDIPPPTRGVAESYILLSESVLPGPSLRPSSAITSTDSTQLAHNLHSILSSRTPIDHPLCTECTTMLQSELQTQLEELKRERDAYISFEQNIVRNRETLRKGRQKEEDEGLGEYDIEGTEEEWDELIRRKAELAEEEDRLRATLREKEKELAQVREEEERVRLEEEEMDRQEEEFLQNHHRTSTTMSHLANQLQTAKTHLLLSQALLAHLEATNVYNDAFQIGHVPLDPAAAGHSITVGTINGLRLGGRPVVDWDEINAAWGLVALCIDRMAKKVGCEFTGYRILPLASYSKIEELPPGKGSYELYASSDLSPARILHNRRFNQGLVALLELLRQLVEFGRRGDRGWGVGNIEIHKDKISSHTIRLPGLASLPTFSLMGLGSSSHASDSSGRDKSDKDDSSGEEQWTRACRAVLLVLKRILVVESEGDKGALMASAPGATPK
ncbi:autophagy protein Apg6-domain-containing protein [Naematelia encephala]|uniref:Autophagy protein Apg6-domain-containing protein n=1 Tax=Naematelia encephala TaxID=71784 RepID=A0A1Y2ALP5_9TREE|nr:autophagy protein Apg6-domain-containing protein [Naematelia encephala]